VIINLLKIIKLPMWIAIIHSTKKSLIRYFWVTTGQTNKPMRQASYPFRQLRGNEDVMAKGFSCIPEMGG
jgi:hypothetical protein